jgi:hypothetical protein
VEKDEGGGSKKVTAELRRRDKRSINSGVKRNQGLNGCSLSKGEENAFNRR